MYYKEQVIDGVLKCRTMPNGPWVKVSEQVQINKLKKEVLGLKSEIEELAVIVKHLNHNVTNPGFGKAFRGR